MFSKLSHYELDGLLMLASMADVGLTLTTTTGITYDKDLNCAQCIRGGFDSFYSSSASNTFPYYADSASSSAITGFCCGDYWDCSSSITEN